MSQPDLLEQIRSSRIDAPADLRERVLAIAAAEPPLPPRRRELPWRRIGFVLAPACLAAAGAVALGVGLAGSGNHSSRRQVALAKPPVVFSSTTGAPDSATTLQPVQHGGLAGGGSTGAAVPATPGRAQLYAADLTLRVSDLSAITKRALRLTQAFHGYVRSVDYGSGTQRGSATLVLRIPIGSVQAAIVRFSALGRILDQHVSIQDVQPQLDKRSRQEQTQRDAITKLKAELEDPALSASDRTTLENRLVAAQRELVALQRAQSALERQTSYATVALDLRTAAKAVPGPAKPSRLGRALHRSGRILVDEARVLVYVLIVGAPLFLVAALAFGGLRLRRRRDESRLLASS